MIHEYLPRIVFVPEKDTLYFGTQQEIVGFSISNGYLLKRYSEWYNKRKCLNMFYIKNNNKLIITDELG